MCIWNIEEVRIDYKPAEKVIVTEQIKFIQ